MRESVSVRLGLPDSWLYLSARVTNCREIDTADAAAKGRSHLFNPGMFDVRDRNPLAETG